MSNIATSGTVYSALTKIDQICDYIPIASTITNFIDIFEKCAFSVCCGCESINSNRYLSHINDKSILRCVTLLVPVLGNIVVGIYDLIQKHRAERDEREYQEAQARRLGVEVNQLPQSISERRQIIENKRQEKLQETTQLGIKTLDMQIVEVRRVVEKFGKIIENPDEPLEFADGLELLGGTYNGTHREKIDCFWSNVKPVYTFQGLGLFFHLNQQETINQKQQELSNLKKELSQLRQTSYRSYVQTIEKAELLQEAKKYYRQCFSTEEREGIKVPVEQMDLDSILPKLKEKVIAKTEKDYAFIEIQEIISRMEQT